MVSPADVGYVEAHGTGTPLGDPIESSARLATAAAGDRPCVIGSVKTNIGHLEAAAGIAGLIKAVLACASAARSRRSLHFHAPNPHIDLDSLGGHASPTAMSPFEARGRGLAGVSSFGFGGTNAHVILAGPPAPTPAAVEPGTDGGPVIVKLSAREGAALADSAARLDAFLTATPQAPLEDIARQLDSGRAQLPERAAIVAHTRTELSHALRALAAGILAAGTYRARAATSTPRLAFLTPGQGTRQLAGAASALAADPRTLDSLAEVLGPLNELPLAALLEPGPDSQHALERTEICQPALYTLALALAAHHARQRPTPTPCSATQPAPTPPPPSPASSTPKTAPS